MWKWAVGKCGIASGRAIAHKRRMKCQRLDLIQKQPQPNVRFGELIPGQVQSLMFRQPQHRRTKLGQGARHWPPGMVSMCHATLVAAAEAHSTGSKVHSHSKSPSAGKSPETADPLVPVHPDSPDLPLATRLLTIRMPMKTSTASCCWHAKRFRPPRQGDSWLGRPFCNGSPFAGLSFIALLPLSRLERPLSSRAC